MSLFEYEHRGSHIAFTLIRTKTKTSQTQCDMYHKEEASDWQLRYLLLTLQLLAHHHVAGKHELLVCNS